MPTLSRADQALIEAVTEALLQEGTLHAGTFTVVLSHRRRSAAITTRPDGHRLVRIVPTSTPGGVARLVRANRSTLAEHARRNEDLAALQPSRALVEGEMFHWLGHPVTLRLHRGPIEPAEPAQMLISPADLERLGATAVANWYCDRGLEWTKGAAPEMWRRLAPGQPLPELVVRDLGKRRSGLYDDQQHRLTLHWRVFQLDADLVQYALCHELTHAARPPGPDHGPGFWQYLTAVMPDARSRHQSLLSAVRSVWTGTVA